MVRTFVGLILAVSLVAGLLSAPVAAAAERVIVLQIDNLQAEVDGRPVALQVPPQIIGGRTMVPVRFIAEALGAEVGYDAAERRITVRLGGSTLEFWVDQARVRRNGAEEIRIDQPPTVVNGRTLAPLRATAELLGGQVAYAAATRTVTLRFPLGAGPGAAFPVLLSDAQFRAAFDTGRRQAPDLGAHIRTGTSASGDTYTLKVLTEWAAAADLGQGRGGALMEPHDLTFLRALRGHLLLSLTADGRPAATLAQYTLRVLQKGSALPGVPLPFQPPIPQAGNAVTLRFLLPVTALDTADTFTVEGWGPGGVREFTHAFNLSYVAAAEPVTGARWTPDRQRVGVLLALTEDQIREAWEWGRSRQRLTEDEILAGHSRMGSLPGGETYRVDLLTEWQEAVLRGYRSGKPPSAEEVKSLLGRRNQMVVRVAVSAADAEAVRDLTFQIDMGNRGVLAPAAATPELVSTPLRTAATYRLSVPTAGIDTTGPFRVVVSRGGQELLRTGWDLVYVDETGLATGSGPRAPQILKDLTDYQRLLAWRYGIKLQQEAPARAAAILAPYAQQDGAYRVSLNTEWVSAFFLGTQQASGGDPAGALPPEATLRQLLGARGQVLFAITLPPSKVGVRLELRARNGSSQDSAEFTPAGTFHVQGFSSQFLNLSLPVEVSLLQNGVPQAYFKFDLSGLNEAQHLAAAAFTFTGPGAFAPLLGEYTSLDAAVSFRYSQGFQPQAPGAGEEAVFVRRDASGRTDAQLTLYQGHPTLATDPAALAQAVEQFAEATAGELAGQGMTVASRENLGELSRGGARLIVAQSGSTQAYVLVLGVMRNQGVIYVLTGVTGAGAQLETEAAVRSFRPTGR